MCSVRSDGGYGRRRWLFRLVQQSELGVTPLQVAVLLGNQQGVETLLALGGTEINHVIQWIQGRTPLQLALAAAGIASDAGPFAGLEGDGADHPVEQIVVRLLDHGGSAAGGQGAGPRGGGKGANTL